MEFILGKPQSNKSIEMQKQALKRANQNIFTPIWYLVPEQYTLQMQRELIGQNDNKGLLNLEVLSFNRLVYRLQNQLQVAGKVALGSSGKAALIYRLLSQNSEKYPILAKKRNSPAFIKSLSSMVTECYQYQMSAEDLKVVSEKLLGELVRDKTRELSLLLADYQQAVKADYFMVESALQEVSEVLKSMDISNIEIFVDGFYGFVPIQINILATLVEKAKNVHIAFPYAVNKNNLGLEDLRYPSELYYDVKNSISKLRAKILPDFEEIRIINENVKGISKEIIKIQDELFQFSKQPESNIAEHIHLAEAATIDEEIRYVAEEILYYIHDKGCRFNEIAVLAGNIQDYAAKIETIFTDYQLTFFMDQKSQIKDHPFIHFIKSILMAIKTNFRYEEWMQHLKNIYIYPDLSDVEAVQKLEDEISRIDIYAIEHGLRGSKSYQNLENLSPELQKILEQVFILEKKLKKKGGFSDKIKALQDYLASMNVAKNFEYQIKDFEKREKWLQQSEYRQVATKVKEYFQDMIKFMEFNISDEEKDVRQFISLTEFVSILLSGIQEIEYASAPPVTDQIVVGSLEHTRLPKCRIIFAIGLREGSVPSVQNDSGFFSDWERQSIQSVAGENLKMAADRKSSIFKAQLTIYMSLMHATEHLYFSYARISESNSASRPANLFYQIHRMFPKNQVKNLSKWWKDHQAVTYPIPTLTSFVKQFHNGEYNDKFISIYQTLKHSELRESLERLIRPVFQANENISGELAQKLYHTQRRMSISRLESFSSCPFLHFLRYGVQAREIIPYQADRVDMGIFLHKVMEAVFRLCQKQNKQIFELTDEEYQTILDQAIQEGFDTDKRNVFSENARNRFMADQLRQIADRAVKTTQMQMSKGTLSFYKEEIRFRKENMAELHFFTDDGKEFYLEGVIDRMDAGKDGDKIYFSILDYKTSAHSLDYTEIFYGLQLQLLIYLKAGEQYLQQAEQGMKAMPVSAAYFHMKNPVFNQAEISDFQAPLAEDFMKSMKLKGVFVMEGLEKLDQSLATENQTMVMNVRLKKDGTPYADSMVLSADELLSLENFAKQKAEKIASQIWQGNTQITPYSFGKEKPCTYCNYQGICKVDLKENPYRYLSKKSKDEIMENLMDKKEP